MANDVPRAVSFTPRTAPVIAALLCCGWTAVIPSAMARTWSTPSAAMRVDGDPEAVERTLTAAARVTADSSFPGYRVDVAVDGRWYAPGEELQPVTDNSQRFGNGGNSWVSGEAATDHWMAFAWSQPVRVNEIEIWWSLRAWYPRAFRVEIERDGQWVAVEGGDVWYAPTQRRSVLVLPVVRTRQLRILQPAAGAHLRRFLALQEVRVACREAAAPGVTGARTVSAEALARQAPRPLRRELADLAVELPGASRSVRWNDQGGCADAPELCGGNAHRPRAPLQHGEAVGVLWPVRHAVERCAVTVRENTADSESLILEVDDGQRWRRLEATATQVQVDDRMQIVWTFTPVVSRGLRVVCRAAQPVLVSELEVDRYLPADQNSWSDRFIAREGLRQEVLADAADPSFERLALCAHGIPTARYPLGLRDHRVETGVAWDGALIGRETIRFTFGAEQRALSEYRDTVRRSLIDGWRPGVIVEGQMHDLYVRQTAFAIPSPGSGKPVVWIRLAVQNLASAPCATSVEVVIEGERPEALSLQDGVIARGDDPLVMSLVPFATSATSESCRIDLALAAGETRCLDLLHSQEAGTDASDLDAVRRLSFEQAQEAFVRCWDGIMATPVSVEVPEERVNRLIRAVLAQIFVCADGDVMYYGAAPSVYEGSLFGIEESYPLLALGLFGYGDAAQRYMSATYLRPDFLRKVDEYSPAEPESRHQQYRNGLQPHYAVSLYRLTRDRAWLEPHLPLLRECAAWTMAARRSTMELADGRRPLHWGLLPRWAYGGDVLEVLCHPFYPNVCCWRGLVDTAWLLDQWGDTAGARAYREEANAYWVDIDRAMTGSFLPDHRPPLLPLRVGGKRADEMLDFYQLFAGCLLDLEALSPESQPAGWISDLLDADNRTFCHLPRYRPMGPGALDALYGKGHLLQLLHGGAVRDYLLGFYAYLAFNMDHDTLVSRESNVLYPSDLHVRGSYGAAEITDPLPCASAVALHLVRHMLVTEERGPAGTYSGRLLLLAGVPRHWLHDGQSIRCMQLPTHFGPVSLEVQSCTRDDRIDARVVPPQREQAAAVRLRLPHPDGHVLESVHVNGSPWDRFDAAGEWIDLPPGTDAINITARYQQP
jgi:hypothetical protein